MTTRRLLVAVFILLALVLPAQAQTVVINPTTVEFTASADRARVVDGVTILTSYRLEITPQAAGTPLKVIDLGKPTPDGSNVITLTNAEWFNVPTGSYLTYVVAIGPGGVGRSEASAVWFSIKEAPGAPGKPLMRGEAPPGLDPLAVPLPWLGALL